jgi:hypothetical protein
MSTINENIRQLLDMLDNPEAYSEQEIRDIINRDEDTRETYRMMVEAKRSSRHRNDTQPINVDAAWQRFNQNLQPKRHRLGWMKVAASFIGVLIVSGIAVAAIHIVRTNSQESRVESQESRVESQLPTDTIKTDTISSKQPVTFDNTALEKMLPQIAAHYGATTEFRNEKTRKLRFHFVWKPEENLDHVVQRLNLFESIVVELNDNKIVVE